MYAWGGKSKSVSCSRVYVCVKAKLTLISFFLFFLLFLMHLALRTPEKDQMANDDHATITRKLLIDPEHATNLP